MNLPHFKSLNSVCCLMEPIFMPKFNIDFYNSDYIYKIEFDYINNSATAYNLQKDKIDLLVTLKYTKLTEEIIK